LVGSECRVRLILTSFGEATHCEPYVVDEIQITSCRHCALAAVARGRAGGEHWRQRVGCGVTHALRRRAGNRANAIETRGFIPRRPRWCPLEVNELSIRTPPYVLRRTSVVLRSAHDVRHGQLELCGICLRTEDGAWYQRCGQSEAKCGTMGGVCKHGVTTDSVFEGGVDSHFTP